MNKGWILCKPNFQESYETVRLVEEFKNQDIEIMMKMREINFNSLIVFMIAMFLLLQT